MHIANTIFNKHMNQLFNCSSLFPKNDSASEMKPDRLFKFAM